MQYIGARFAAVDTNLTCLRSVVIARYSGCWDQADWSITLAERLPRSLAGEEHGESAPRDAVRLRRMAQSDIVELSSR